MAGFYEQRDQDGILIGWQARIRKKGFPTQSKVFRTRREAEAWATVVESEMVRGVFVSRSEAEGTTLGEAIEQYIKEVTPLLHGAAGAISSLRQVDAFLGRYSLAAITPILVSQYRDARLKVVSPTTVRHDLACLSRVLVWLEKERGVFLPLGNPVRRIRLPRPAKGRERRLDAGEYERLMEAARAYGGDMPYIIDWAIETAMRREKIIAMCWDQVDIPKRILTVPSLVGEKPVPVKLPLSARAVAVLTSVPRRIDGRVWGITSPNSVSKAFTEIRNRAGLPDLHFHDLRHEATSRLFELGLNPMQVSAITGHKTLQMLKRYTQLRPEDLARLMDGEVATRQQASKSL